MKNRITLAAVLDIFKDAKDQADYLIGIYKLVFPNWDQIATISGWPSVNDYTWKTICRMAMDWDQKHVESLAGGAWLNNGFSTSCGEKLANWEVSMEGVTVTLAAAA